MPRKRFGFVITAALLAATAACSTAGAATASPASAHAKPEPKPVDVLSASFVSPSTGWLLAEPACVHQAHPCTTTVLMRKTVNGGRTWSAVPAPPAPPANMFQSSPPPNSVGRLLFTSASDGWAVGASLWRTTDGGATWHRLRVPGPLAAFTVAGGRMLGVVVHCPNVGTCTLREYAASTGEDTWRLVPGTALTRDNGAWLAVIRQTGYLLASQGIGKPVLLAGPVTGAARWQSLKVPCPGLLSGALAATGGWLFLGCGNEPSAGNQLKTAYVSHDGGHTWHQVASPPTGGYLGGATMTAGGTIFLSGERMEVDTSRDRGRSWDGNSFPGGAGGLAGAGFSLVGTTVTDTFGVAVQEGVVTQQVWLTKDAGRSWTPVTIR